MLDARRLEVLRTVVAERSVSQAAAVLGYTPSAVSQAVSALERELGLPLLEKAGRGIRPTQAALLLAEHACAVSERLAAAHKAIEDFRAGRRGKVGVAAFATAGAALVPRAIADYRAKHPEVQLDIEIAETDQALTRLRAGDIDVAVVAEHRELDEKNVRDLIVTHLLEDPYRLVVPRSHPSAKRRSVDLAELSAESWIATSSGRCNSLPVLTDACAVAGFSPNLAIEADEFSTTLGFVGVGLGVSLVPLLALNALPTDVAVTRVKGQDPKRYVYALARKGDSSLVMVTEMVDALRISAGSRLHAVA